MCSCPCMLTRPCHAAARAHRPCACVQVDMGGGVSAEQAVLSGTERSNAARKRPTAVKRAVLKARAARAAADAAAEANVKAAALAAARGAAADVQRQYEVGLLALQTAFAACACTDGGSE